MGTADLQFSAQRHMLKVCKVRSADFIALTFTGPLCTAYIVESSAASTSEFRHQGYETAVQLRAEQDIHTLVRRVAPIAHFMHGIASKDSCSVDKHQYLSLA